MPLIPGDRCGSQILGAAPAPEHIAVGIVGIEVTDELLGRITTAAQRLAVEVGAERANHTGPLVTVEHAQRCDERPVGPYPDVHDAPPGIELREEPPLQLVSPVRHLQVHVLTNGSIDPDSFSKAPVLGMELPMMAATVQSDVRQVRPPIVGPVPDVM